MGARGVCIMVCVACSGPPPPAPSAIITETPSSVCIGDDFTTPIQIDSSGTSNELSLVSSPPSADASAPTLAWSFSGAVCKGLPTDPTLPDGGPWCDVKIDPGSLDPTGAVNGTSVLVTVAGDRPVFVTLRVQNAAGGVTEAQSTITITPLDPTGACPLPQGL